MKANLDWYQSPLGRRITDIEVDAAKGINDLEAMVARAGKVFKAATPRRKRALETFVQATFTAPMEAAIMKATTLATIRALHAAKPEAPAPDYAAIEAEFEAKRPELLKSLHTESLVLNALIYQSLTDAEFGKYLQYLQSPGGAQFYRAAVQAVQRATMLGLGRMIDSLATKRT